MINMAINVNRSHGSCSAATAPAPKTELQMFLVRTFQNCKSCWLLWRENAKKEVILGIVVGDLGLVPVTLVSSLCVLGPDVKFKGVFHPLVISPTRVTELFEVTQTPDGGEPLSQ